MLENSIAFIFAAQNRNDNTHDMGLNLEKLSSMAVKSSDEAIARAKERKANRKRLRMSQEIALTIHYYLKQCNITQKELAERIGVSPAYIGKLLKGNENLTLETICRIEDAIGKKLISVYRPYTFTTTAILCNLPDSGFPSKSDAYKVAVCGKDYVSSDDAA